MLRYYACEREKNYVKTHYGSSVEERKDGNMKIEKKRKKKHKKRNKVKTEKERKEEEEE